MNTLPNNVSRCNGVWIEDGDYHSGWREGCEKCLRRTAPVSIENHVPYLTPPPIIAFECEYLIEPEQP